MEYEVRGIQILFVLKWISPMAYWFFYFTRSFRIFADPNGDKASKTLDHVGYIIDNYRIISFAYDVNYQH